jgi:hypothetical protein
VTYTPQTWVANTTVVSADRMNYIENGIAAAGGASAVPLNWIALPYQAGFSDFGYGFEAGGYAIDAVTKTVHLRGLLNVGVTVQPDTSVVVATLPPTARPLANAMFAAAAAPNNFARVDVFADGSVYIWGPSPNARGFVPGDFCSLGGISISQT